MLLLDIVINTKALTTEQLNELLPLHRAWYNKYFAEGKFIMVGPYTDTDIPSGVVIADLASKAELEQIIAEDAFYNNHGTYTIREFKANLIKDILAS
ncbi:hypothetical protein CKF54_07415 [Psittacicella hinzii]|uniref:YCII-related domain-containing protein n=1 Tax=Psittacicella hinzii TaxID=2028575 RepID=A0A3A1Y0M7_9GAMM|nr:YciI family protein [Psittacicella hinzii]RIY31145.1 hypothetical protein CKF54_07415 [Psittacicella hinzii]